MMLGQSGEVRLTEGSVSRSLLSFFYPIALGMLFQQLYNTVDAVIVGKFVGDGALAAVGGSSLQLVNLVIGFFSGLSSGAGVLISQLFGARREKELSVMVHTTLLFSVLAGAVMAAIMILLVPGLLVLLKTPEDTLADSVLYLRIYFGGMIPLLLYNVGSGILRAVGDSRRPLLYLIVCCGSNIVLDLFFVLVLGQGVAGAAVATVLAEAVSAVLVLRCLLSSSGACRLVPARLGINGRALKNMLRLGIPAGLQTTMYSISNTVIQVFINRFDTQVVAAWAATSKFDGIFWVLTNAFGMALCAFVGQCYGAGLTGRLREGIRTCLKLLLGVAAGLSLLLLAIAPRGLYLFTNEPQVVSYARQMMLCFVPFYVVWAFIEIYANSLRGMGESLAPMLITMAGACLLRLAWLYIMVPRFPSIITISLSYPVSWALTAAALYGYYRFFTRRKLVFPANDATIGEKP